LSALPPLIDKDVLKTLREDHKLELEPTTYEAAVAFLQEELKKPENEQDLHREICVMAVLAVPKNQKVAFMHKTYGTLITLEEGEKLLDGVSWNCSCSLRDPL
jgi:hypothetical protein